MKIHYIILAALLSAAVPMQAAQTGIDWHKGNIDRAFTIAKSRNKPVFLYWGAVWCPPCNQVKATIFNRQGFIERSQFFVPVYLDGDSQDGQKLAARFKVRGYPTMILFKPDGSEITRLPGEVDSERYLQVLELAMHATRSMKDTLHLALSDSAQLKTDDWRLLADYSWDTDEQQLLNHKDLPTTLHKLAIACPINDTAMRLTLKALIAANITANNENIPDIDKTAALAQVTKILSNAQYARDNMDLLTNNVKNIVEFISEQKTEQRTQLIENWNKALQKLAADTTLSKADRLSALSAQVTLARIDIPEGALEPAFLNKIRQQVQQTERATTDLYERQAVVSAAAGTLTQVGLLDESDALLKAELKRSHSPYYFMLALASNAKKRNDKPAALHWYEQAYKTAKGPATRLQWGVAYLTGLIDLVPDQEARIEHAAKNVIAELNHTKNAFYERNRVALDRLGRKLAQWNVDKQHEASVQRLSNQLERICTGLPAGDAPQRAACQDVRNAIGAIGS